MTPISLTLQGFLSYRDKETFDFAKDNHRLWMLSGANGAGKSSVFDAITFALFKEHRHGGQNAHLLINTQADAASVEFEFAVGDKRYRAQRNIRKVKRYDKVKGREVVTGKVTGALYEWDSAVWAALPNAEGDYTDQIERVLGLNYAAFTMSVLLPQNKANQVVESKPEARCNLLKQVVGLGEYEALCERAKARESELKVIVREREGRLEKDSALVAVTDDEIKAADEAATVAEKAKITAQTERDLCADLLTPARSFDEWSQKAAVLRDQIKNDEALLGDASAVRKRAERRVLLNDALPFLRVANNAYQTLALSRADLEKARSTEAQTAGELAARLKLSDGATADAVGQALKERLDVTKRAYACYPTVAAFCLARSEAHTAHDKMRDAEARAEGTLQPDPWEAWGRLYREAEGRAHEALQQAQALLAQWDGARKDVETRLQTFSSDGDQATCAICGQDLTPELREAQRERLQSELAMAQARFQAATTAERDAKTAYDAAVEDREKGEREYKGLVQDKSDADRDVVNARAEYETKKKRCDVAKNDVILQKVREKLGDAAGGYPSEAEQQEMKADADSAQPWRDRADEWSRVQDAVERDLTTVDNAARKREEERAHIPEAWRDHPAAEDKTALAELSDEYNALKNAAQELESLQAAERGLADLRATKTALETNIAALPDGASQGLDSAQKALAAADAARNTAVANEISANARCDGLRARQSARREAQNERDAAEQKRALWKYLAELLGNERLQRELLRDAETAITIKANETLAQFPGSILHLSESKETTGRSLNTALNLVCANATLPGDTLPLESLSGSQKFRVSVALALALGQYVAGGHARLRSVIIDEGFGSLDPQNLEAMADVMHGLGETLERVIVVSHQETFADRFPNRYHISLDEGSSRIRRPEPTA